MSLLKRIFLILLLFALLLNSYPARADQAVLHANTTFVNTTEGSATRTSWTAADWLGEIGTELSLSDYLSVGRTDALRAYQAGSATTDAFFRTNWTKAMPSSILSINWIHACAAFNKTASKDSKKFAMWNYTGSSWTEIADGGTAAAEWGYCFNVSGTNLTAFVGGGYGFITLSRSYGTNADGVNLNTMNITVDYAPRDITAPNITVQFPINGTFYNANAIWFNITLDETGNWSGFSLDGAANVTMQNNSGNWNYLNSSMTDGLHTVKFYANDSAGNMNVSTPLVYFTVDTQLPTIYMQSPQNITYLNKTIDLNVSANEPISVWKYSINGTANVTFTPNTTITVSAGANNITVYANDSAGNMNSTIAYFTLNTTLDVSMAEPSTASPTDFVRNTTFLVNATVFCRHGSCGNIVGTVLYNKTSENPDTPVNITAGAEPFYIQEASPASTKSCSGNPLSEGQFCNLTWTINATDSTQSSWKLAVNFSSDSGWTAPNTTSAATVSIVPCFVDITVNWASIEFSGYLNPNTYQNPASGNDGRLYNITVNEGSCNTDLYIKGTNMENSTLGYSLGAGNLTWSNTSNTYSSSFNMTQSYRPIELDVPQLTNITTWYWINVPPIYAANYNGTVFIQGVKNGDGLP